MHIVRGWDLPTRVFHWTLALAVPAMVVSGEIGGAWMEWHFRLGYAVLTLLLFRLGWGFVGGHWSRFGSFVRRPTDVWAYLRQAPAPASAPGHNPLGGYSVLAMLTMLACQAASGLMSDDEILSAGPLVHKASEALVRTMTYLHTGPVKYLLVFLLLLHLLAIAWYRFGKRQNLLGPMLLGDKVLEQSTIASRDDAGTRSLALLLALACAGAVAALLAWAR